MRSPGRPPAGPREHRVRFWAAMRGARPLGSRRACRPWLAPGGVARLAGIGRHGPGVGRYLSFAEREEIAPLRAQDCGGERPPAGSVGLRRGSRVSYGERRDAHRPAEVSGEHCAVARGSACSPS